jgi:2'-5' RNA ligase
MFREVLKTQALRLVLGVGGLAFSVSTAFANNVNCLFQTMAFFDANTNAQGTRVLSSRDSRVTKAHLPDAVTSVVDRRGPWGQDMAVQQLNDGQVGVFGTASAVKIARPDAVELGPLVLKVTGTGSPLGSVRKYVIDGEEVTIQLASSLVGSGRLTRNFSDLDTELTIVVGYKSFLQSDFYDPESRFARAYEMFIKEYVDQVSSSGFLFTDMKAGEYDYVPEFALATQSKAIKWAYTDIKAGIRSIMNRAGQAQTLTLRTALTQDSRVKIDWVFKMATPPEVRGLSDRYVEASVVFNVAGRKGNNNPVAYLSQADLFPANNATGAHLSIAGCANSKPLKITSLFFDPAHVELARQISISAPHSDLAYLNQVVVNAAQTYWGQGRKFKAVRMLETRLQYWNDFPAFAVEARMAGWGESSLEEVARQFAEVTQNPDVRALYFWLESVRPYLKVLNPQNIDPDFELKMVNYLSESLRFRPEGAPALAEDSKNIHEVLHWYESAVSKEIEARVDQLVRERPLLEKYVGYVFKLVSAKSYSVLSSGNSYFYYSLPATVVESYRAKLAVWVKTYPNLNFLPPEQLHLTVAFAGQIPSHLTGKLSDIQVRYSGSLASHEFTLTSAGFNIFGRNNGVLAVGFDPLSVPSDVAGQIQLMRSEIASLGSPVDVFFDRWNPHLTIARVGTGSKAEASQVEMARFLANEDIESIIPGAQTLVGGRIHLESETNGAARRASDEEVAEGLVGILDGGH